jgi:iron-sulfur cluster repair protein YtfE (RIC family)
MIQIGASAATIDSPIEHLVACHRRIEQRLDTLVSAASHLQDQRSAALAAIASSFSFLDTSGVLHTKDEEASLFPRLRKKLSASEIEFVDSLEAQHVQAEGIYSRLKQLASQLLSPA